MVEIRLEVNLDVDEKADVKAIIELIRWACSTPHPGVLGVKKVQAVKEI